MLRKMKIRLCPENVQKMSRLCPENIEFLYHLRWIAKILDIFQTNSNSRQNLNVGNGHILGHFLDIRLSGI